MIHRITTLIDRKSVYIAVTEQLKKSYMHKRQITLLTNEATVKACFKFNS
jgi:hypothetical protein